MGAHSPAIFADAASSAAGAFDDDPFAAAVGDLVDRMRSPRFHQWKGGHDEDYWSSHMDEYVDFYVDALADC